MRHLLQSALLIVVSMLLTGIALAGIILSAEHFSLTQLSPADMLPEHETTMLVMHPTTQTEELLRIAYPDLGNMNTENADALAAIEIDGSTIGIVFRKEDNHYIFEGTDPRVRALLSEERHRLGSKDSFRSMMEITGKDASWIWTSTPQLIVFEENLVRIMREGGLFPAWEALREVPRIETALRHFVAQFSEDISVTYDILPLLGSESTLQVRENNAFISGTSVDIQKTQNQFDQFHALYRETLPTAIVTRRVLDQRFSSVDLREGQKEQMEYRYIIDGWHVEQTTNGARDLELITATKGSRFLIGTNILQLEQLLAGDGMLKAQSGAILLNTTMRSGLEMTTIEPREKAQYLLDYLL